MNKTSTKNTLNLARYVATGIWLLLQSFASGHGDGDNPILIAVNQSTNQVQVSSGFDDAVVSGAFLTFHPGVAVPSRFAGVPEGATIHLRVIQRLLYSNSDELATTSAKVTITSADFVQSVEVTESSGLLDPLAWAVYPFPEESADGIYQLGDGTPTAGVYGVGLQALVDGAIASEPFLLAVVNNPANLELSRDALQAGLRSLAEADFTRDWQIDASDLQAWQSHFGLSESPGTAKVFGDADNDGHVNGSDFLQWQRSVGQSSTTTASLVSVDPIPEPASLTLILGVVWAFAATDRLARAGSIPL